MTLDLALDLALDLVPWISVSQILVIFINSQSNGRMNQLKSIIH